MSRVVLKGPERRFGPIRTLKRGVVWMCKLSEDLNANKSCVVEFNWRRLYTGLRSGYRLRLWFATSASRGARYLCSSWSFLSLMVASVPLSPFFSFELLTLLP